MFDKFKRKLSKDNKQIKSFNNSLKLKKLNKLITDLGLQLPIPLKTLNGNSVANTINILVLNSNNVIYLPSALTSSYSYEDELRGGEEVSGVSGIGNDDGATGIRNDDGATGNNDGATGNDDGSTGNDVNSAAGLRGNDDGATGNDVNSGDGDNNESLDSHAGISTESERNTGGFSEEVLKRNFDINNRGVNSDNDGSISTGGNDSLQYSRTSRRESLESIDSTTGDITGELSTSNIDLVSAMPSRESIDSNNVLDYNPNTKSVENFPSTIEFKPSFSGIDSNITSESNSNFARASDNPLFKSVFNGGEPRRGSLNLTSTPSFPKPTPVSRSQSTSVRSKPDRSNSISGQSIPKVTIPNTLTKFSTPSYLCTNIDAESPIPHTFAIIVELVKDMVVKDVAINFSSICSILWPTGDPYRAYYKEKFNVGTIHWTKTLAEADYFIDETSPTNNNSQVTLEILAERTRQYRLKEYLEPEADLSLTKTRSRDSFQKAGYYVFLLPILLPEHIPASISSINGSLIHNLSVVVNKISDTLNRKIKLAANYNLPCVRTPPSFANSIANKPIFVNRVWNDSLHYFITFPSKYVNLGSEHVIGIKLIPLVKDVIIKRIKFNVLERLTYVSRDMTREYDFDSNDPFCLKSTHSKARERLVPLCELKTKAASNAHHADPFKEEVIICPDNNLLFSCYEADDANSRISTPLDINIALPFLTTKSDKTLLTSNTIQEPHNPSRKASITGKYPESPIIGNLETTLNNLQEDDIPITSFSPVSSLFSGEETHSDKPSAMMKKGITSISRALYPDSNFRHIQITHRLQVCFRISRPDPKDKFKMHHYEVVVDTPLILLSSKCNKENLQLPNYDEINEMYPIPINSNSPVEFRTPIFEKNGISIKPLRDDVDQLPTFEEATKSYESPVERTISVGSPIERTFSFDDDPLDVSARPSLPPNYEESEFKDELRDEILGSSGIMAYRPKIRSSLSQSFSQKNNEADIERFDGSDELGSFDRIDRIVTATSSIPHNDNESIPSGPNHMSQSSLLRRVSQTSISSEFSGEDYETKSLLNVYNQKLPLLDHYSNDVINRKGTDSIQLDISDSQAMFPNQSNQII